MISVVFVLIFLSNVFCNVDHGTLPGCSIQIKESVGINDVQFGTLGSVVYGGIVVGSVVATGIFSRSSWIKPIIVLTLSLNAGALFVFTLLKEFIIMAMLRFMIGFFQVFICIYMPVWADTFANSEQQKAAWITFLIMASPLGIFLGFTLTSVMVSWKTWEWSFYI